MNAKKAKALRRIAENGSVGYSAVERVRTLVKPGSLSSPPKYRIEHADRTTRGLYRLLKKSAKRTD
jgi:hypothetical protein